MKVLIFDMDGVLVVTMPFHYVAMKMAIKEVAYIDLDKRAYYLLEGLSVPYIVISLVGSLKVSDGFNICEWPRQPDQ
jgi:beta-phosphoglucomutase-like phosphatase (HAD superfamily)